MIDQRWRVAFLAPLALAAALYLPGIGQRILYIGDEARYALLARTMVETGDWLLPGIRDRRHDGRKSARPDGDLLGLSRARALGQGPGRALAADSLRRVSGLGGRLARPRQAEAADGRGHRRADLGALGTRVRARERR